MTQTIASLDPLLVNIVLITLAIGLPILIVLSARFLWDRKLEIGRSKELEKLIWQLHRIATALEHQMNLSFPAVQPGTEEARDISYLKPLASAANPVTPAVAPPNTSASTSASNSASATAQPAVQQPEAPAPTAQQPSIPLPVLQEPAEVPRRAGVNSMFGL